MNQNQTSVALLKDPAFYLSHFVKIKGKTPGLIPFVLNEAQRDLYNTLVEHNRVMILKARQLGFSTGVAGYFYHNTIMTPGTNTAIIGYNTSLTSELLDKIKTFYRTTPAELRPTLHYDSKYELSFPRLDSKIIVLPSTENVGRGYTLHNVLCTELSAWEKAEEKMMALEASVPINGKIVIESTPRGQGNLYHRMWMSDNDYVKKEYGWWWGYKKEEIEIIERRMNDPQRFAQEYGLQFLSSGRPVFDAMVIRAHRKNVLNVGDVYEGRKVTEVDGWRVFKEAEPNGLYVIGADVAEGVMGGDYSTACVLDRKTGEQMASYRGIIAADRFGEELNTWGRSYNNALMAVEVNNHGLTTLTVLKQKIYPSLYFRQSKFEQISSGTSDKMGWKTTKLTRPLLIDDLAKAMREYSIVVHCKETLDEMSMFVYDDNNNAVAPSGQHDDLIFATGIALQAFKILYDKPLTQINYAQHLPTTSPY